MTPESKALYHNYMLQTHCLMSGTFSRTFPWAVGLGFRQTKLIVTGISFVASNIRIKRAAKGGACNACQSDASDLDSLHIVRKGIVVLRIVLVELPATLIDINKSGSARRLG